MTVLLASVILPNVNGLPQDRYQNDFVMQGSSVAAIVAVTNAGIEAFYNTAYSGHYVGEYLSTAIDRGSGKCSINYYDITTHLDGSPHGSPVATDPFTLNAAAVTTPLPEEVSLCMSFHGAYGTLIETGAVDTAIPSTESARDQGAPATHTGVDRPRSRLRGRIYVGPLNLQAITTSNPVRPTSTARATIALAGGGLLALTTSPWAVWSRRNATVITTSTGWVDDAFDTQRRRGLKSSTRSTF